MKGRTCSSSIPTSASTVVYVSRNVPSKRSSPDTEDDVEKWVELNREYSEKWPNITRKGGSPEDADDYTDEDGKLEKYFSANPGSGS